MTSFASASASSEMQTSPWRPSVPSPLASSPIRPTSTSPEPPHIRADNDTSAFNQRATQSSPIQKPSSRFASRPSRPNPLVRRREDVQEQRRRNFLHSVRHKADERAWRRRDIEGQALKTSWLANIGRLSHDAPVLSDVDIEDAVAHSQEAAQSSSLGNGMLEVITEEDELESLVSAYEQQQQSLPLSFERDDDDDDDDDDYDDLFAELILREPADRIGEPSSTEQGPSSAMDMTD